MQVGMLNGGTCWLEVVPFRACTGGMQARSHLSQLSFILCNQQYSSGLDRCGPVMSASLLHCCRHVESTMHSTALIAAVLEMTAEAAKLGSVFIPSSLMAIKHCYQACIFVVAGSCS